MAQKERLDVLLVQKSLANSRELAKAYIMAGNVYVDNIKEDKAGTKVSIEANIEVRGNQMKYVSRGGYKLEKAIDNFGLSLENTVCLDIGASTGGFTDCMLQNGAIKVYAIDVGYGQFAWKLRTDERVVCLEKTNVRYITEKEVPDLADFASIDVSFISLTKVLPAVLNVMGDKGKLVCLIKPQFEAGREKVGKKGVVKDKSVHFEVIEKMINFANNYTEFEKELENRNKENKENQETQKINRNTSLSVFNIDFSPIKGPEGNIEYLIYIGKNVDENDYKLSLDEAIEKAKEVVAKSHETLVKS